jgi:hypothetical protein
MIEKLAPILLKIVRNHSCFQAILNKHPSPLPRAGGGPWAGGGRCVFSKYFENSCCLVTMKKYFKIF